MAKTARIELRAEPEREQRIRYAASLAHQSVTSFVLNAASERAEEIIAASSITIVPADFFDQLNSALAGPPEPNATLAKVARRSPRVRQV